MSTMTVTLQLLMYHCIDCNNRFNKPDYWIVEDAWGRLRKIPYCPNCVSQNIEQIELTE